MCHIYSREFCSVINIEISAFAGIWLELQSIIVRQTIQLRSLKVILFLFYVEMRENKRKEVGFDLQKIKDRLVKKFFQGMIEGEKHCGQTLAKLYCYSVYCVHVQICNSKSHQQIPPFTTTINQRKCGKNMTVDGKNHHGYSVSFFP